MLFSDHLTVSLGTDTILGGCSYRKRGEAAVCDGLPQGSLSHTLAGLAIALMLLRSIPFL
jgi:hypothetical protein